jgi:hypothetical protein
MSDTNESDWIAQLDQATAGMRDLSKAMRVYYVALLEQAFTADQALVLTVALQSSVMASVGKASSE